MQYGEELTKRELGIMGGLVLSAGIFSALYNRVGEIVSTAWPPQQRPTVHPVTDGWQNAEPQEILPLNCLHEAQGRHPPHWVERSNTASALKEKLIRTNQPNFTASLY
ncbi:hypothetical protein W02_10410 [Nitrospira sp. KM1]|nr:hypothetical protein W02_10410 [Nitrospira sp. KM1]